MLFSNGRDRRPIDDGERELCLGNIEPKMSVVRWFQIQLNEKRPTDPERIAYTAAFDADTRARSRARERPARLYASLICGVIRVTILGSNRPSLRPR